MIKACGVGLAGLAVLVVLLAAAAGGVISAVLNPFTSGTDNQAGPNPSAGCTPGYTAEQVANAATIIRVGQRLGVPQQGWVIALSTALQESGLHNLNYGDRDSLGVFQQRPSQGWGTPEEVMNPDYAATAFYRHLLAVPGWDRMTVTDAAQAVQRSATPGAYARHEPAARALATTLTACTTATPPPVPSTAPPVVAAPANPANDTAAEAIATVVAYARAQVGTPYVWGGDGPTEGGFDCSGLVHAAYQAAGINLPRTAETQFRAGPRLPPQEDLQPGDLVFYRAPGAQKITHVALVSGGGKVVQAPDRGKLVEEVPLPRKDFAGATRPVNQDLLRQTQRRGGAFLSVVAGRAGVLDRGGWIDEWVYRARCCGCINVVFAATSCCVVGVVRGYRLWEVWRRAVTVATKALVPSASARGHLGWASALGRGRSL